MDNNNKNDFSIGDIQVSPSHNQMSLKGKTVKLQPKVMAVLHYLACHCERVISNEELIDRLWEGRVVTHGSVQKSINALRCAFSELNNDQDMIAHYSKRGYQLTLTPLFLAANSPTTLEPQSNITAAATQDKNATAKRLKTLSTKWILLGAFILLTIVAFAYYAAQPPKLTIVKHHKSHFSTSLGYTSETGHERNAIPHPDNMHVAYIREKFNASGLGETDSEILIRDAQGKDWPITSSQGSWFKLAWSPAGKHLVAIEVKRDEGQSYSPNFYEKPNYLYSFHIFSLDLINHRLLEKQQLSQWQGRINSVTWWDENTLEFIAQQGGSTAARYRYSIQDQHLIQLDEIEGAANLIASAVHNKKTAIASLHNNKIQIDFLNENQTRINRWLLSVATADISWIPDGSGILIYAEDARRLLTLYMDGEQVQIPLTDNKDKIFSRPRYQPDGSAIFYTEEKRSSNILWMKLDGTKTHLTENTDFNYAASFSPTGKQVVYASVRNNQIHLWLIEDGQERQLSSLPISGKVGAIVWSKDAEHLLYSAGTGLYHYNFITKETSLIIKDTHKIEPVAYFPDRHQLLALKNNRDFRSLWRIDTQNQQQKQLTFGAVGAALEYKGDIIFQYAGKKGLWAIRNNNDALEQITPTLSGNIKLLSADDKGVYFIDGGLCRESDIYYVEYSTGIKSTRLIRDSKIVATTSFHPSAGTLQTECYLAEANIILLK